MIAGLVGIQGLGEVGSRFLVPLIPDEFPGRTAARTGVVARARDPQRAPIRRLNR